MKSKFILTMIVLTLLVAGPQVYAKTSIEIKPNASLVYTNKPISNFFEESKEMNKSGEVLEGANVDVHMAKNTEWAIVSYFSNSDYGTSGKGENKGIIVSVDGKDYLSTNGNVTGVMDFGKTTTYTAGLISDYEKIVDTDSTDEAYDWGKEIIKNAANSKHVDLINTLSWESMGVTGWYSAGADVGYREGAPFSMRFGLFGMLGGAWNSSGTSNGKPNKAYTFRPVIYN